MINIGIGLPTRRAATRPDTLFEWLERADASPLSSLAVMDRVVSDALEPLAMLAVAAGATKRIRLIASVLIGPTRETTLLARQTASIEILSGGRLSVGLGVGVRDDDYTATGQRFRSRGRRLDEQLELLRRLWRGEPMSDDVGAIGPTTPRPDGPELLIGGYVDAVARRIATWGDGYMAPGGADDATLTANWQRIRSAWTEAGRSGAPRFVGGSYFALGPDAPEAVRSYLGAAYGHDPNLAERRIRGVPTDPAGLRSTIDRWTSLGVDELILRPVTDDPDEIERLVHVASIEHLARG